MISARDRALHARKDGVEARRLLAARLAAQAQQRGLGEATVAAAQRPADGVGVAFWREDLGAHGRLDRGGDQLGADDDRARQLDRRGLDGQRQQGVDVGAREQVEAVAHKRGRQPGVRGGVVVVERGAGDGRR